MSTPKNEYRIEGEVVWIKLTQGKETCIDLADWPLVSQYRWYAHKRRTLWYAAKSDGDTIHRLLFSGKQVDHQDGNSLNNRRYNLRPTSQRNNCANRGLSSRSTSGFKGVSLNKRNGKWRAYIQKSLKGGRMLFHQLGEFMNKVDAARAYNNKALEIFGEFARLNPV